MRHKDIRTTLEIYTDVGLLGADSILNVPGLSVPQNCLKKGEKQGKTNPLDVIRSLVEMLEIKGETVVSAFSEMVEVRGVEPLTSCMPCKRSTN